MRTTSSSSTPGFVADPNSLRQSTGRQIDWPSVGDEFRSDSTYVEVSTNTAADATALPVVALLKALPSGAVVQFAADKYITTTAAAAIGDTSLTVEALTTAVVDGDAGYFAGVQPKVLPAGTVLAIDGNGKGVPALSGSSAEILVSSATESGTRAGFQDANTGYGTIIGGHLYENLLPDAVSGDLNGTAKTALGSLFTWTDYADSRLS